MTSWGSQYSTGDQGSDRVKFYKNGMNECPKCQSKDIRCFKDVAGCRHDGDAYGTEVYTCKTCGWETSFQYDEAGGSYYYEMRDAIREPDPPPSPVELSESIVRKYLKVKLSLRYSTNIESIIRSGLQAEGCSEMDIARFFRISEASNIEATIAKELGIS